jgi:hypothetical protein
MPRGLTIEEAAKHLGLSVSGFRHWLKRSGVKCRIMGTHRYDIRALDAALDRLSGIAQPAAPRDAFEDWEAKWNEARSPAYQAR